ncbi:MAG: hypothetical protein R3A48_07405 [Polyangiales bacterium]
MELIRVRGARTHNLKAVDLDIPRGALVVITGPSGCGKSSLAFDTIYAEGRRRYIESLNVSARRMLGGAGRAPVDSIEGLSPAIAVSQGSISRSPRSTVGTVTELDDHLRLLLARVGEVRCPGCGEVVVARSPSEVVDEVMALGEGARAMILAPLGRRRVGPHGATFAALRRDGFVRVRVNGEVLSLDELPELDDDAPLDLDLVVDRVVLRPSSRARVLDAVELALQRGDGAVRVAVVEGVELALTTRFACAACDRVLPEVTPALLSFNSPAGACPRCLGLGTLRETSSLVRNPARSLRGGAIYIGRQNGPAPAPAAPPPAAGAPPPPPAARPRRGRGRRSSSATEKTFRASPRSPRAAKTSRRRASTRRRPATSATARGSAPRPGSCASPTPTSSRSPESPSTRSARGSARTPLPRATPRSPGACSARCSVASTT